MTNDNHEPVLALFPRHCSLDQSVRLLGRHENLVVVLQPEWRKIHQQAVEVGHAQMYFGNGRDRSQRGLPHLVEGSLNGWTVVFRKSLEHRLHNVSVGKTEICWNVPE